MKPFARLISVTFLCGNSWAFQADGALQGSAGEAIDEIREQILGVVSTAMWGEFNGAGTSMLC